MTVHSLKTVNPYFTAVWRYKKTAELRLNDRDYKVGDRLHLREYDIISNTYTGREMMLYVSDILKDFPELTHGWVMISFKPIQRSRKPIKHIITMEKLRGIELIAQERREQIEKHGRSTENDVKHIEYSPGPMGRTHH